MKVLEANGKSMDLLIEFFDKLDKLQNQVTTLWNATKCFCQLYSILSDEGRDACNKIVFQALLHSLGIKDVSTISCNPIANGIVECMHKTVRNILRSYIHENTQAYTLSNARKIVDAALATALYAIRTNIHSTTGYSPGALAFCRDMLLDILLVVNLIAI